MRSRYCNCAGAAPCPYIDGRRESSDTAMSGGSPGPSKSGMILNGQRRTSRSDEKGQALVAASPGHVEKEPIVCPQHTTTRPSRQTECETMTCEDCGRPLYFVHGHAPGEYVSCLFKCTGGHETVTRILPHKTGTIYWREVG